MTKLKNLFRLLLLSIIICSCNVNGNKNDKLIYNIKNGEDINQSAIGVMTGSFGEIYIEENFPKAQLSRYDDITDAITALRTKKVDYVMTSYTTAINAKRHNDNITILTKEFTQEGAVVAMSKDCDVNLLNNINKSIDRMKADGTLSRMIDRWIKNDGGEYVDIEDSIPRVKNGKLLNVGISANREPMCFVKDGKIIGLDVELMRRIAYDMGMIINFSDMKFSALTASLMSGKVDVVASNFTATAERAKVVSFSNTYFINPQVLICSNNTITEGDKNSTWYKKLENSFYTNLIEEDRYKLILDGLVKTIVIAFFSIIIGTILGGCVCLLRMNKIKTLSNIAKAYINIMRGTPILVMLMIVFYVVFAKSGLSATIIAILTFAMNFAAYTSEMFRSSIISIDKGQKEAGIAMGFTSSQTFVNIILPQAIKRVMPIYKGEVISLVKMTSVVGYIAVQDLTKASDVIRSRTFDAFFPLIVITILYFILAWIFGYALDLLNKKAYK